MKRRVAMSLAAAAAVVLPLSACSGDDSATSPTSPVPQAGTTLPGADTTTSVANTGSTEPGVTQIPLTSLTDTVVLDTLDTAVDEVNLELPTQDNLPADGPATVGGVSLPAGKVLVNNDARLAWITDAAVPDTAKVWLELIAKVDETGLYPVILRDDDQPASWEQAELFPNQPGTIDGLDALEVLQNAAQFNFDPPRTFETLAPASSGAADVAAADTAIAELPDARLLLVETKRGADALSIMGWTGNALYDTTESLVAVVRSWEERFGARLVAAGPSSITLAISTPPATSAEAAALSTELAIMDPNLETGGTPIPVVSLGDGLLGQVLWTLWWG